MEKEKKSRLVILLGIIFLLLQILQISFNIHFIFIFAIMVISIIIIAFFKPKISILNLTTAIKIILLLAVAIIVIMFITIQVPKSLKYLENRTAESFDNNEIHKDYRIYHGEYGQYLIEDEKLLIHGLVSITNKDILYQYPDFYFHIGGIENGKNVIIRVTLKSDSEECIFSFPVKSYYTETVQFGTRKHNRVYAKINNWDLRDEIPVMYFNTSVPYEATVEIISDGRGTQYSCGIGKICLGD